MASQITSLTIVHSTVYSGIGQRMYQTAFVRGIPVTQKMFPFDDVITQPQFTVLYVTFVWKNKGG